MWRLPVALAIVLSSSIARADDDVSALVQSVEASDHFLNYELAQVSYGAAAPWLANLTFSADGKRNGAAVHFSATGRDLGFTRPILHDVHVRLLTVRLLGPVMVGLNIGVEGRSLDPADVQPGSHAGAGHDILGVGGGLHAQVGWSWRFLDLRADVELGVRGMSIDLAGFDLDTCSTKGGAKYPCKTQAWGTQPYVAPRASAGVNISQWVTLGAYAGLDVTSGVGWSAGGFLSVRGWDGESSRGRRNRRRL